MAVAIGNPGYGALKGGLLRRAVAAVILTFITCIVIIGGANALGSTRFTWISAIMIFVLAGEIYFFRSSFLELIEIYREGGNFLKGSDGERLAAAELSKLSDQYVVFNDFHPRRDGVNARWNVDHIVIGPTGVFVVETKNYARARVRSAARNSFSKRNVAQAQRNSLELKSSVVKWSGGVLGDLFVVPIVVYAQEGAQLEQLREGPVRTLPLRLLTREIVSHKEGAIDMDRAYRLARVLYDQMDVSEREPFSEDIVRYGRIARSAPRGATAAATERQQTATPAAESCPNCGHELVRRTARKGPHAGNVFLACPGYPDCRFTKPLPQE